jgi:hypothetical protein
VRLLNRFKKDQQVVLESCKAISLLSSTLSSDLLRCEAYSILLDLSGSAIPQNELVLVIQALFDLTEASGTVSSTFKIVRDGLKVWKTDREVSLKIFAALCSDSLKVHYLQLLTLDMEHSLWIPLSEAIRFWMDDRELALLSIQILAACLMHWKTKAYRDGAEQLLLDLLKRWKDDADVSTGICDHLYVFVDMFQYNKHRLRNINRFNDTIEQCAANSEVKLRLQNAIRKKNGGCCIN